jgi:hypothetical protein
MLRKTTGLLMALLIATGGVAFADADLASEIEALRATVRTQGQEIQQMRTAAGDTWLNERRAEEVKALISDVLADADTRASLIGEGADAGHDGTHFYLRNASNDFLMEISALVQVRYIFSIRNGEPVISDSLDPSDKANNPNESGFEVPRAKLQFAGHVGSPRIMYVLGLEVDRLTNDVFIDRATLGYALTDTITIGGGEDKGPFLREELTSAQHQLAVERTFVNEVFTIGKIQGIWASWRGLDDMLHVRAAISDGSLSGEHKVAYVDSGSPLELTQPSKRFDMDDSDFAFTLRTDLKVEGDWNQMTDFTAWGGEPLAIFAGAAIHWESRETGDSFGSPGALAGHNYDTFIWTVDGSVEYERANLYVAIMGADFSGEGSLTSDPTDPDPFGVIVQGGYQIIDRKLDAFARWEYLNLDIDPSSGHLGAGKDDTINILTVGGNWYLSKHRSKVTVDLLWAMDPIPDTDTAFLMGPLNGTSTSLVGLLGDLGDSEDQTVLRIQYTQQF